MKLVLLDVDGTILLTQGTGRPAMTAALERVLGHPITTDGVSFSGKTDVQIMRDILRASGLDPSLDGDLLQHALAAYQEELPLHMSPERVRVLPGVPELIQALHERSDFCLGLLTGNLKRTAFLKLAAVGLDGYFLFGAFGSDHEDRNCLPPIAIERAVELTNYTFAPDEVFVIGDTTHDVVCGKMSGCRTVAVCTGHYSREELEAASPDLLCNDFSDYQSLLDYLSGGVEERAS